MSFLSQNQTNMALCFLSQIVKNLVVSPYLSDLSPKNYSPLEHPFKFADV